MAAKSPCPRAAPSGSGLFTAIISSAPCYNYYIKSVPNISTDQHIIMDCMLYSWKGSVTCIVFIFFQNRGEENKLPVIIISTQ